MDILNRTIIVKDRETGIVRIYDREGWLIKIFENNDEYVKWVESLK